MHLRQVAGGTMVTTYLDSFEQVGLHPRQCIDTLSIVDLYSQLALDVSLKEDELLALQSLGDLARFPAGSILMGEGEMTDFALLIRKGQVKITSGCPPRIIAIRGPGALVGEMAAIRRKPRSANAFALNDVEALYLSATNWLSFLNENSRVVMAQLYAAHERLSEATARVVQSLLGAERKLANAMLELVSRDLGDPSSNGTLLRFSQQDLADFAGISLDSVKQVVRSFKAKEIITTGREMTIIRDLGALVAVARGDLTASI